MANMLMGTSRGNEPMAKPTGLALIWPQWMVKASTGEKRVFAFPDDVPEGWVTKDQYRTMQGTQKTDGWTSTARIRTGDLVQVGDGPVAAVIDPEDRPRLFAEAKALGLSVWKGIKTEDLRAKIQEAKKTA